MVSVGRLSSEGLCGQATAKITSPPFSRRRDDAKKLIKNINRCVFTLGEAALLKPWSTVRAAAGHAAEPAEGAVAALDAHFVTVALQAVRGRGLGVGVGVR